MSKSKKKKRKKVLKEIKEMEKIIEFLVENTPYYYLDTVQKLLFVKILTTMAIKIGVINLIYLLLLRVLLE